MIIRRYDGAMTISIGDAVALKRSTKHMIVRDMYMDGGTEWLVVSPPDNPRNPRVVKAADCLHVPADMVPDFSVIHIADIGVGEDGLVYAEYHGERETSPLVIGPDGWWRDAVMQAGSSALKALGDRLGIEDLRYRYAHDHPFCQRT